MKFAKSKELSILKYHLTPRTKGFAFLVEHLRNNLKSVVDITIAYPNWPTDTILNLLMGETVDVLVYVR